MYAEHAPKIAEHMRASVDGFKRGMFFVIASIRQPITAVPDQVAEIEEHGTSAPCLFSHKVDAIAYIETHAAALLSDVLAARNECEAIAKLTRIPGLGIVKAAFALQLMGFDVACLDARNIKREGRNPRAYRSDGGKSKDGLAWRRKIARYVAETRGRAAYYWDAWCHDVATVYEMTAEEISALHLTTIVRTRQYTLDETF